MTRVLVLVLLTLATCGRAVPVTGSVERCRLPDDEGPSRRAFFQEALFAAESPRTSSFDDHTDGSYQVVSKHDFAVGLPEEAGRCGQHLRAVIAIGPLLPMGTFRILTLLDEGDGVRVNLLVFPHARIAAKFTARRTRAEVDAILHDITTSPLVRAGTDKKDVLEFLLAEYGEGAPRTWPGVLSRFDYLAEGADALLATVDRLMAGAEKTY